MISVIFEKFYYIIYLKNMRKKVYHSGGFGCLSIVNAIIIPKTARRAT